MIQTLSTGLATSSLLMPYCEVSSSNKLFTADDIEEYGEEHYAIRTAVMCAECNSADAYLSTQIAGICLKFLMALAQNVKLVIPNTDYP